MSRVEGSGAENGSYTEQVLSTFRQRQPYTFFTTSSLAAHIESIPMADAYPVVVGAIQSIRESHYFVSNEAILSVFGTQGYMWTPDSTSVQSCLPVGFRSDVFYGYLEKYQHALSIAWNAMRVVDIADEMTAYPRVKEVTYQDMLFFAENFGQNISLETYAQVLDRDKATAHQRIRMMAKFLSSIPESGLAVITSRGFSEYRLDLQS